MNVLMMTNTYQPHVCGVARSVASCSEALRRRGHQVLIVAPQPEEPQPDDANVVRVPAVHHVTANDIPVRLPIPGYLWTTLTDFKPDIVHAHHPFLLGSTALRIAATWKLPVVFTYHTMYEHYTHNVPGDSAPLERFTIRLATEFCNQCDHIVAPSESVRDVLRERGVVVPISVVPTGIDLAAFSIGDGEAGRRAHGIPHEAFLVGHVGRLTPEKNLEFLARAVSRYLARHPRAWFLVVGEGPQREAIQHICRGAGVGDRLVMSAGALAGRDLADAYAAMDCMAFSSKSETQGMVLAEAMAAGAPVVALDASGARDIVRDWVNGRLLPSEDDEAFAAAIEWVERAARNPRLGRELRRTARAFSLENTVAQLEDVYRAAAQNSTRNECPDGLLPTFLQRVTEEYNLWSRIGRAMYDAAFGDDERTHTTSRR
jgi:1,2-diacylglycerol 3-alpha-glucosyltransferase